MTLMLGMLRRISEQLNIQPETSERERAEKLGEETNVYELMQALEKELPDSRDTS
jgi:hypothetical protein